MYKHWISDSPLGISNIETRKKTIGKFELTTFRKSMMRRMVASHRKLKSTSM